MTAIVSPKGQKMRMFLILLICTAEAIFSVAATADDSPLSIVDRLKTGGHVLMIRHALAPGSGDPPNFTIGDCSTQRNLNDTGRTQARNIGSWLRASGVSSARVYSSQWCRCLETAQLMNMGTVAELSALNSFYELTQDREPHLNALNDFISRQPPEGQLIIFVTHFVTIAAITGEGVSSGEGMLLKLNGDGSYTVIGNIDFGR